VQINLEETKIAPPIPQSNVLVIPGPELRGGSGASTSYSKNETSGKNSAASGEGYRIQKGHSLMEALELYDEELTGFELGEIRNYPFIYTIGSVRILSQGDC
jgi:hypothetical protein